MSYEDEIQALREILELKTSLVALEAEYINAQESGDVEAIERTGTVFANARKEIKIKEQSQQNSVTIRPATVQLQSELPPPGE